MAPTLTLAVTRACLAATVVSYITSVISSEKFRKCLYSPDAVLPDRLKKSSQSLQQRITGLGQELVGSILEHKVIDLRQYL